MGHGGKERQHTKWATSTGSGVEPTHSPGRQSLRSPLGRVRGGAAVRPPCPTVLFAHIGWPACVEMPLLLHPWSPCRPLMVPGATHLHLWLRPALFPGPLFPVTSFSGEQRARVFGKRSRPCGEPGSMNKQGSSGRTGKGPRTRAAGGQGVRAENPTTQEWYLLCGDSGLPSPSSAAPAATGTTMMRDADPRPR